MNAASVSVEQPSARESLDSGSPRKNDGSSAGRRPQGQRAGFLRSVLASVICVWVTSAASGNSEGNRAEIAVILVNVHSQITNVSSSDLRKIFLGQITRWPNRHRINLLVRPDDSTEEKLLLSRLLRISDIDYAQHWVGQVFRGDAASPPRMIESVAGMKARLAEGEDAMGLLLQSQLTAKDAQSLRVLMIDNRLPDDPKYPLRK